MANLQETAQWETGIYQLETSDPVMGGADGIDNRQAKQLGNRTLWLRNELVRISRTIPAAVTKSDEVNSDSSTDVATSKAVGKRSIRRGQNQRQPRHRRRKNLYCHRLL